jgi:two-component system KDP operon response regulator KdpE
MNEQATVLVIGSDAAELRRVASWFGLSQLTVITSDDWARGLRELYAQRPNALVLLSDEAHPVRWNEVELVLNLCDIPVLVVAERATRGSLQRAVDLGLAGYLVKPIDYKRLTDRVLAALEKAARNSVASMPEFRHEGLHIDWRRFEVRVDGRLVRLSPTEFKLLSLLVQRQGEVVTHGEILARVWGPNYDLTERRNIKLYVWYLRQKLERDPARPRWIVTRNGLGYIFGAPAEDEEQAVSPIPHTRERALVAS